MLSAFEQQVCENPQRIAVVERCAGGAKHLTYAQLDQRARQLASALLQRGLTSEQLIAVALSPSTELLVALLGALKAGGAFLPLDPRHPALYHRRILDAARPAYVVAERQWLERTQPTVANADALLAIDEPATWQQSFGDRARALAESAELAYVIFTSGSTGTPKGVQVSRSGLDAYLTWARARYGAITKLDCTLFTSPAVDMTLTSVFLPLVSGHRVVIHREQEHEVPAVVRSIRDASCSLIKLTPAHISLLAEYKLVAPWIEQVIVGGEALLGSHVRALRAIVGPRACIQNEYGPTEAVVGCMAHALQAGDVVPETVPIGRPSTSSRIYLLDDFQHPVPEGVTGEIYIGGRSLALGYRADPRLTAECFVPDAFVPGQRMYRSGDLGRWAEHDELVFAGRQDDLVKIRSTRVELGEVEAALSQHPAVRACVVQHVAPSVPPVARATTQQLCSVCGLPSNYPGTDYDGNGVCNMCREFDAYRARAMAYFGTPQQLEELLKSAPARAKPGGHDCMLLLSGGKDSTYALYRLVAMGLRVCAFTLDNGYLSDGAKANIRRAVDDLGIEHQYARSPAMGRVFVESLEQHSNVCNGCFKLTYTLSMIEAQRRGIPFIVTGLSRGQLFENRLLEIYRAGIFDVAEVDRTIVAARKVYHRQQDSIARAHDLKVFRQDAIYDDVRIVDFFRYFDVTLDEMISSLESTAWSRPADTGRSTNCLINDVGIYVHQRQKGFHNYALPCSWDVRLGHKTRAQALDELADHIDEASVQRILRDTGYQAQLARDTVDARAEPSLAAYLVAEPEPTASELRTFLAERLPEFMLPRTFVMLSELPIGANGKVDRRALPAIDGSRPRLETPFVAPRSHTERRVAEIWSRLLGVETIGVHDSFFQLGGHSLLAVRLTATMARELGVDVPLHALFGMPTVAGVSALVEAERQGGRTANDLPVIVPDPGARFRPFPLTEAQEAYWVGRMKGFELGNVAIHGFLELECVDLDLERLNQAWNRLIARHDMLRAVVHPDATQTVLEHVPSFRMPIIDLRAEPRSAAEAALAQIREQLSHELRDLESWPLFDIRAVRVDERTTRLVISIDVLNIDEGSFLILSAELVSFYKQPTLVLRPLDVSFRDFVLAERALQNSERYRKSWEYWVARLLELPAAPELPRATAALAVEQPRFTRSSFRLEPEQWQGLEARGKALGASRSALLLSAYAEVLALWSASPRFTINVPVYNRPPLHPQIDGVVGVFTSINLLEVDSLAADTFAQRTRRIQEQLWLDLDHRYVSGVRILRELSRLHGRGTAALMPVVFTNVIGMGARQGQGLEALGRVVHGISQTPQVWLDCQISEDGDGLFIAWDAVADIFPDGVLASMFDAFRRLVLELAGDEQGSWNASVRTLPLLKEDQLAARRAANDTAEPGAVTLAPMRFVEQAHVHPEQPAVISERGRLSYGELLTHAECVAAELARHGVRRGDAIAVVMEKGWEQVVAVQAIQLCGAAYVPLDPDEPTERARYMLERAEVKIALVQEHRRESWPLSGSITQVAVGGTLGASRRTSENWIALPAENDLAYVLFTSGSTGKPKGVMIEQGSVANRVADVNRRWSIGAHDRVFGITALTHDLSVYDLFGTLAAGAALVLPSAQHVRDPAHWLALLAAEHVTLWNSVPRFMEMLLEYVEHNPAAMSGELTELRLVMLSGDRIAPSLPARIRRVFPRAAVISLGGPTETTFWDICFPIPERWDPEQRIPYGRPMANATYHVLDAWLRPRPDWVPGELYIGGHGLMRGYCGDAAATAQRMVIDASGERLYRSGDVGRYLPDGTLEILGRVDFQTKIGGMRIELGEIEDAICSLEQVAESVVVAQPAPQGPELVAYVVPSREASVADGGDAKRARDELAFRMSRPGLRQVEDASRAVALRRPAYSPAEYDAQLERRSRRYFLAKPLPAEELGAWLHCLAAETVEGVPLPKYRYASAGSLYPVQTYLYLKPERVLGIAGGSYYYDPDTHRLVHLDGAAPVTRDLVGEANRRLFDQAGLALLLIAKLDAIDPVYPSDALRFAAIEAGLMTQLLETEARAHGVGVCQIGGLQFEPLRTSLGLNERHVLIHAVLGGRIERRSNDALRELRAELERERRAAASDAGDLPGLLREALASKLPEHMLPRRVVMLARLPRTPSGKVDRKALPAALTPQPVLDVVFQRAEAPLERQLLAIWQDVLGLAPSAEIGIDHNFFDIGANSVHVVRVQAHLQERLARELPIADLFAHPSIRALAAYLERRNDDQPALERSAAKGSERRAQRVARAEQRRRAT